MGGHDGGTNRLDWHRGHGRPHGAQLAEHEIWLKSTGDCVAVRTRVPLRNVVQNNPVDQDYRPGYPIEHALKDLKLIESSAKELGLSTLGMPEVISVYEAAMQQGLAKKDISTIAEVLQ
jgi:3-hydroxyisobutyrate dehydrogenase